MASADEGGHLRTLLRRYPAGVCVLTVAVDGQRLGLTLASLVTISLDPPLVGFAVSKEAAIHELVREAGGGALSLLAAGQERLAQHFSRGVPPIAMWDGIATIGCASRAPLLAGALGWIDCALSEELAAGTHTFFVCEALRVELGAEGAALVRIRSEYLSA